MKQEQADTEEAWRPAGGASVQNYQPPLYRGGKWLFIPPREVWSIPAEYMLVVPRAEAQALVDAGGE